ncbi:MAG: hypothetical protein A2937_03985 [Candidatus Yonathbacteria bacterium RIFCSPLOWO2_01_FULL_47_33b]|uniref:Uncharacterized protein n=1 Tax=Candidatus Yonathbacteria bacterium RIFCSPLOWO2_01_FULL_47_33b TaxID=1802727 RepID=A0A1G2SDZ3_9BACT|nr:MAG: hypothetical protein A2937_03985 [Candidatus Yonathbacteria bacterium RIFCSPLOWO2_01_FULL_47_33b]
MKISDEKMQKQVRIASKKLGVTENEIVKRAISSYLGNFEDLVNLQKELHTWDILSAKSMRKYNF